MAYEIEAWEKDGPNGEARIAVKRIKRIAEIYGVVASFRDLPNCVHITKTRSDGQDARTRAEVRGGLRKYMRKVTTLWCAPEYRAL